MKAPLGGDFVGLSESLDIRGDDTGRERRLVTPPKLPGGILLLGCVFTSLIPSSSKCVGTFLSGGERRGDLGGGSPSDGDSVSSESGA